MACSVELGRCHDGRQATQSGVGQAREGERLLDAAELMSNMCFRIDLHDQVHSQPWRLGAELRRIILWGGERRNYAVDRFLICSTEL